MLFSVYVAFFLGSVAMYSLNINTLAKRTIVFSISSSELLYSVYYGTIPRPRVVSILTNNHYSMYLMLIIDKHFRPIAIYIYYIYGYISSTVQLGLADHVDRSHVPFTMATILSPW